MKPADTYSHHRARLLVVDDMELNRALMAQQFGRHGYHVTLAEDGPQALETIDNNVFDLVLLDIRMPEMDGFQVLKRIRQTHSALSLPVIMVTAENLNEVIVEALQLGANDYLIKPINLPVAIARIEAQLGLSHMATIKDDIVRFASHDLKKPLLVMQDIAQTLKDEIEAGQKLPEDSRELLDLLLRTGHNMQGVISGFLDQEAFRHHPQERNHQPLDINKVVMSSIEGNSSYASRKAINLNQQLADNLPMVAANEFRLLQIMDNLIGNALKFSPTGSSVEVITRLDHNNDVHVDIRDNGPGLRDEDFPKLFQKHAKLSNAPTGGETSSGVGLSLCKQLIELDHGSIGAVNNADAGTTFWISLPAN